MTVFSRPSSGVAAGDAIPFHDDGVTCLLFPRSTRPPMKAGQTEPSSLPATSSRPRMRRWLTLSRPVATRAAMSTTQPPSRTVTYVASCQR